LNKTDPQVVVRIQSAWRGFRARYLVALLRKASKVKKKYFLEEEFWETLSKTAGFTRPQLLQILSNQASSLTTKAP
jgi:hypothetical protein